MDERPLLKSLAPSHRRAERRLSSRPMRELSPLGLKPLPAPRLRQPEPELVPGSARTVIGKLVVESD